MLLEVNRHRFTVVVPTDFRDLPLAALAALKSRGPVIVAVPAEELDVAKIHLANSVDHVTSTDTESYLAIETTIARILEDYDAQPYETIVITNSTAYIGEIIPLRVGTILVGIPALEVLPDVYADSWEDALRKLLSETPGWFAELVLSDRRPGQPIASRGRFLIVEKSEEIPGEASARALIIGRSFPRSDARSNKHQYSQRILKLKNGGDVDRFARGATAIAKWLMGHGGIGLITRVPPRDPFNDPLGEVAQKAGDLLDIPVDLAVLKRVRAYIPQKDIGDYSNRRENVRGAFRATELPGPTRILLIDDIYTSGSTSLESARALATAGASHVDILAFGKNQHLITPLVGEGYCCKKCGSIMRLRISAANKAYWSCSNYGVCDHREYYDVGLTAANELNKRSASRNEDVAF